MNKRIVIIAVALSCTAPACSGPKPEVTHNPPPPEPVDTAPDAVGEPDPLPPDGRPTTAINPPPPVPSGPASEAANTDPSAPASFTGSNFTTRASTTVNPTIDGKHVYRSSTGSCYVDGQRDASLPIPPPGTPLPQVGVDCPPELNDAVYDVCHGGLVYMNNGECGCFVMGNPPPPARALSRCPAHTANHESP